MFFSFSSSFSSVQFVQFCDVIENAVRDLIVYFSKFALLSFAPASRSLCSIRASCLFRVPHISQCSFLLKMRRRAGHSAQPPLPTSSHQQTGREKPKRVPLVLLVERMLLLRVLRVSFLRLRQRSAA